MCKAIATLLSVSILTNYPLVQVYTGSFLFNSIECGNLIDKIKVDSVAGVQGIRKLCDVIDNSSSQLLELMIS